MNAPSTLALPELMTKDATPDGGTGQPSNEAPGYLLQVDGIARVFEGDTEPNVVFEDLNLQVQRGEFVSLVGPSGCGKTTLLQCLCGLMPVTAGRIRLQGREVFEPPDGMSVVFQDYSRSLFPWKRYRDNVMFGMRRLRDLTRADKKRLAGEMLNAVGLAGFGNHYPWQVSGGMQQRVAIARALGSRSELVLLDEPFASLDAQTRADMHELILNLFHRYNQTCILVTHDIEEAVYLGTRVCVLSNRPSKIIFDAAVDLPNPRDQISTRERPEFLALRHKLMELIKKPAAVNSPAP